VESQSFYTLFHPLITYLSKRHIMKFRYLFYALLACSGSWLNSCSDDEDDGPVLPSSINRNANPTSIAHAGRLEMPRLKGGSTNLFLVHSTPAYGINLCIEWDCTKRAQRWTAYQLYASNSVVNWNRNEWNHTEWEGDPFQIDKSIPSAYRTTLEQYRGSGYNRGHICPSADRLCSKDANEQTYYLSNIQPQRYGFNTGVWLEMENKLRTWNHASFRDTLYIVKGGTIDRADQIIHTTSKGLLVPKYYFMAILCKNKSQSQYGYKALAFWAEHKDNPDKNLRKYVISIDELEARTGIDFFCNLPDEIENQVERNLVPTAWGFPN